MNTNLPATIQFSDQSLAIVERSGKAWLSAADLARALDYADTSAVSRIYSRHASEFTDDMTLTVNLTVRAAVAAKPVRIFSPRGCHLIAMFAHTDRAAAFRRWVLDVLEGLAKPVPPAVQADPGLVEILPPINGMITEAGKGLLAGSLLALLNRFGAMPQVVEELERYGQLPVPAETQQQLASLRMQTELMARESARLAQVADRLAAGYMGSRTSTLSQQGRHAIAARAIAEIKQALDIHDV